MTPRNLIAQAYFDSPLGPLTMAATRAAWPGSGSMASIHHPGALDAPQDARQTFIALAYADLERYWRDGAQARFHVPLDPQGTAFQQAVADAAANPRGGHQHLCHGGGAHRQAAGGAGRWAPRSGATRCRSSFPATACWGAMDR